MWTTDQLGLAVWCDRQSSWHFDVRGGDFGIGVLAAKGAGTESRSVDDRYISILPVDGNPLPLAREQYVRGKRYFVNYPQGHGNYAIRLALEAVETRSNSVILEAVISIQTDLLDSHPMLDLVAEGRKVKCFDQAVNDDWRSAIASRASGSPSITVVSGASASTAVLLGPHDSPFTSDCSNDQSMCLRLFGDFLEKGVIRTARPWIVIDTSGEMEVPEHLIAWYRQLCDSPIPLSS